MYEDNPFAKPFTPLFEDIFDLNDTGRSPYCLNPYGHTDGRMLHDPGTLTFSKPFPHRETRMDIPIRSGDLFPTSEADWEMFGGNAGLEFGFEVIGGGAHWLKREHAAEPTQKCAIVRCPDDHSINALASPADEEE